jgi:hypothetical protein
MKPINKLCLWFDGPYPPRSNGEMLFRACCGAVGMFCVVVFIDWAGL